MYDGYLRLGDSEIINSRRAVAHALNGVCSMGFDVVEDTSWRQTHVWLGEEDYVTPGLTGAPWVDEARPESLEFGGVLATNVEGLDTTEVEQEVRDATGDGGSLGRRRLPVRVVSVECVLVAASSRGLEWGLRWLTRSLLEGACGEDAPGVRGGVDGRDLLFLESVPEYVQGERAADIQARVAGLTKMATGVVVTKTPSVKQLAGRSVVRGDTGACTAIVEFELTAMVPRLWGSPVVLLGRKELKRGERLSTRFQELDKDGSCPANCDDDGGVLVDPNMGELWSLPRPVAPGAEIGCQLLDSKRSVFTIRESVIPLTGEMLPTVVVRAGGREERHIRIRWARGMVVDDGAALDCQTVGEAMVTYLPPEAVLTLDGRTGQAYADLADGRRVDATPVMVGRAGGPWRAPVMTCGAPYTLVVDGDVGTQATIEVSGVTGEV